MKRTLSLAALLALAAPLAQAANENATARALRAECASQHPVAMEGAPAAHEYRFVYNKGEYRGEQQAGRALPCSEGQYAQYLASADPARVMAAYPTAAGRAKAAAK